MRFGMAARANVAQCRTWKRKNERLNTTHSYIQTGIQGRRPGGRVARPSPFIDVRQDVMM